jgi:hypothetical protein
MYKGTDGGIAPQKQNIRVERGWIQRSRKHRKWECKNAGKNNIDYIFYAKGIIHHEFAPEKQTVNSTFYEDAIKSLVFWAFDLLYERCMCQSGRGLYWVMVSSYWSGLRMSQLGTLATIRPTTPVLDDSWRRIWSSQWTDWQGKPKYLEKTCHSATLSTTNPTRSDLDLYPVRHSGKLATVWATVRPLGDGVNKHLFIYVVWFLQFRDLIVILYIPLIELERHL